MGALGVSSAIAMSQNEAGKQQQDPLCSKSLRNYISEIHVTPPRGRDACLGMIV